MKPIGVDIAKDAAHFAWRYQHGTGWEIHVANPSDPDALQGILETAKAFGCDLVAIEQPFLGKDNPKTFQVLSGVLMRVQVAAESVGLKVITPYPATWRESIRWAGYLPKLRKELKAQSVLVAKAEGAKVENDDEADAVNICVWAESCGEEMLAAEEVKG